MRRTTTVIIGGGQAGLAMSRHLTDRGIDHVVLERGRVGERWRSERWDSLRLLTPNWMTRLPGQAYDGPDPDGYMTMPEITAFLDRYARSIAAPVETGTTVRSVESCGDGYRIRTDRGAWQASNVVVATGYCDRPFVPPLAHRLSGDVQQLTPSNYRHPRQLRDGGVLVVGASSTGVQLAEEIQASGRPVTLSVGRHIRLPRTYRGRDILWWMARMGALDESAERVFDIERSRLQPSLQLVGQPDHRSLGLRELHAGGVRLVGRTLAADGRLVTFDDGLAASAAAADYKLAGLLQRIDRYIERHGLGREVEAAGPFEPSWPLFFDRRPATGLALAAEGISTVIWATGFRRSYPWLHVPVLDTHGEIAHREGVTAAPGLFVLGLQFQRRRKSAFIDGVGDDAAFLADRISGRAEADAPGWARECGCDQGAGPWLRH